MSYWLMGRPTRQPPTIAVWAEPLVNVYQLLLLLRGPANLLEYISRQLRHFLTLYAY